MFKTRITKKQIALFLGILIFLYATKFKEYAAESFIELKSYVESSNELLSELGNIEDINIISFKKGHSKNVNRVMYRIEIEGTLENKKLFFYMSDKSGAWKVNKYGVKP